MSRPVDELYRLANLAGIADWEEVKRQAVRAAEIPSLLEGGVDLAWQKCLPEWIVFGRVRDRSWGVRTPKYWPSFVTRLGQSFVEQYRDDYQFLTSRLDHYAVESTEYLCACDLLVQLLHESAYDAPDVITRLLALEHDLPPIFRLECEGLPEFEHRTGFLGELLRAIYETNYAD